MRGPRTLRALALGWLAQREHSERELRRKLLDRLRRRDAAADAGSAAPHRGVRSEPKGGPGPRPTRGSGEGLDHDSEALSGDGAQHAGRSADHRAEVDAVIAWLLEHRYLNEQRFVESRVHARAPRFGAARIEHELSMHGVELDLQAAQALRASEYERALAVWRRRFGEPVADIRAAARQARFLAGRGFGQDVIRRVLRDGPRTPSDEEQ